MDSIELQNNIKIFENNLKSLDEDYILAERQSLENINVVAAELKTQEAKLQTQYAKLDKESADQLEHRTQLIESSIAKAKKSIKTVLEQEPKADAKTMYQTMLQVWTKDIPLYDIQLASVYSVELQNLYEKFQNLFVKYSQLKSGGDNESFITGSATNLPDNKEQLLHSMRNTMAEFSIRLGLLEKEILQETTKSIAKYKEIKRKLIEKDTIIPSLRSSLQTLQKAERDRQQTVLQTQKAYKEQYTIYKKEFDQAQEKAVQQQKLAEASREQSIVIKPETKTNKRLDFPSVTSATFTQEMTKRFQKYAMAAKDVSQGSQCSVEGATQPPKNYQELISDLMEPDLPYRGFLANYGTGSGKTRLSALTIEKWFLRKLMMTGSYGSPVLVLLPNTNLISSWRKEMKQWLQNFEVADAIQSLNTTVLSVNKPNEVNKRGYIILHKITVVLPPPVKSLMMKTMGPNETLISNENYVLAPINYNHECYAMLSSASKRLLEIALQNQQTEVRRRETAVTSDSLIIGDESHNWINPQEIARDVTASTTVLAWANTIKSAKNIKVLELTATPLLDDAKLSDLIKALNLVAVPANPDGQSVTPLFEGIWRRGLASADSDEYKNAVVLADEAESNYIAKQLFDDKGMWLPFKKRLFQKMYGPVFSYITLSNDPTVYPSFTKDCGVAKDTCTYQWNPTTSDLDPISESALQELELPKPSEGRNILVPMAFTQYQKLAADMNTDLNNWALTRRLDADPAKPSMSDINYSAKSTKSSVLGSRGMKVYTDKGVMEWSPKADVLFHLMKQYPTDKFFAFTSSNDQIFAKTMTSYIQKVTNYEVFDIVQASRFLKSQGPKTSMKELVQSFYSKHSPRKRVILFVASATVVKEIGANLIDKVKEFMVDLFNETEKNLNGEYFQLFLGDRNTKEGINLFHTMHAVLLDVSASKTMWLQSKARVLRYCSHRKMPIEKWSQVTLWTLINLPSILKVKAKKVRAAAKKRRGGNDITEANPFANYVYPDSMPLDLAVQQPLHPSYPLQQLQPPLKMLPHRGLLEQLPPLLPSLSAPSSQNKTLDYNRVRTNEEWQALYLASHEPVSIKVVLALIEGSFTCPLFRPYNQEPQACLDEVVSSSFETSKPLYKKSNRYCVNLGLITVQLENSETLVEVAENLVSLDAPTSGFEFQCKSNVVSMNPPSYRDTLVLRRLLTPFDINPSSSNQLELFTEILDELNESGPFKVAQDLELWNMVSQLDDKHKEALLEIQRRKQLLVSEDNLLTFTSLVNQFEAWIKIKNKASAIFDQWMRFLTTKPVLLVVSRAGGFSS